MAPIRVNRFTIGSIWFSARLGRNMPMERVALGRSGSEDEMKGFNWISNARVLVCIIAALLFTLWFALWLRYY